MCAVVTKTEIRTQNSRPRSRKAVNEGQRPIEYRTRVNAKCEIQDTASEQFHKISGASLPKMMVYYLLK